jgi:predicted GNAT family N-acyltransferase
MKTKQQTMTSTSPQLEARSSDSSQEAITGMATVKFTILLQPPPGPNISPIFPTTNKKINNTNNDTNDDDDDGDHVANPPIFNDALSVRRTVFVDEQGCSADGELDDDDARSWHWVLYASHSRSQAPSPSSSPSDSLNNPGSDSSRIPVAVIRLVPPPHAAHPHPHPHPHPYAHSSSSSSGGHDKDGLSIKEPQKQQQQEEEEPYIKLGRIAVLPSYRGHGLSRLLLQTVENWALSHADEINSNSANSSSHQTQNKNNIRWKGLILIHSQVQVQSIYERFGYRVDESMGMWYEEGICHVGMWKRVVD